MFRPLIRSRAQLGWSAIIVLLLVSGCGSDGSRSDATTAEPPPIAVTTITGVGPWEYGDDSVLDSLWRSCDAGDSEACDELYLSSAAGSEYEQFGDTCGYRSDGGGCPPDPSPSDSASTTGTPAVLDGSSGDIDALCQEATSDLGTIPTSGDSAEDFAAEEYAVSQVLRDLAVALSDAGAEDLSAAVEAYAGSRAELAIAYGENLLEKVNEASDAVDRAASALVLAAQDAGSSACEAVPEAG
jgi:hypothetical protein